MKSQRRHELEQNELAQWLGETIAKIKPYQNILIGLLVVVLIAGAAYAFWTRKSESRSQAAWTALFEAMASGDPFQYDDVIEQYPGTRAAECAAVMAGDAHLTYGCDQLFQNKATANQQLRRATEYYLQVLETTDDESLRERATFGLARALEAQGRDLEEARKRYREVVENWPDGPFALAAQHRLEQLERKETLAMYDRFAKFDPKPAFSDEPGVPGQKPPFDLESLPEESPLFSPDSPFSSSPASSSGSDSAAPIELPSLAPGEPDSGKAGEQPGAETGQGGSEAAGSQPEGEPAGAEGGENAGPQAPDNTPSGQAEQSEADNGTPAHSSPEGSGTAAAGAGLEESGTQSSSQQAGSSSAPAEPETAPAPEAAEQPARQQNQAQGS